METSTKKKKDVAVRKTAEPASKEATPAPQEEKRRPIKSFREEDVSASVWSRQHRVQGEYRTFYSVTFERSYKDANGEYRYTKTFDLGDLGKLVKLIQRVDEYMNSLAYPEAEPLPE
jgi:hypothetical protein